MENIEKGSSQSDMSVPAYRRDENKMTIINKTTEMMKEVIRLAKNEKVLPKKVEKILKQTFIEDAIKIYKYINSANQLDLNDNMETVLRKQFQIKAKIGLMDLYSQIKLNIAYLDTAYGKYENLIQMIDSVKNLLNKWVKSDDLRRDPNKSK